MFDAAVKGIKLTADISWRTQSERAAIEAAAVAYGDPIGALAAGERIRQRQQEVGVSARTARELRADILSLSAITSSPLVQINNAQALARAFVETLKEVDGSDLQNLFYLRSEYCIYRHKVWQRLSSDDVAAHLTRFLQKSPGCQVTSKLVTDCLANLKGLCIFPDSNTSMPTYIESLEPLLVQKRNLLRVQNGLLDLDAVLEGGADLLHPHDARYFSTQKIDYDFDPSAQCPQWQSTLNQILPVAGSHDRRQEVLQEFSGYTLLSNCRYEKALLLFGRAHAGKSTVAKVLENMLGVINVSHVPFNDLGNQFRLIELTGKAANISAEIDHLGRSNENLLKQLISGEAISANRKFKSAVELVSHAKLINACNELPNLQDGSDGIWRRLIILPFLNPIPLAQRNLLLHEELLAERPGILNWSLEGLRRLHTQRQFTTCAMCASELQRHKQASDTVAEFLDECGVKVPGARADAQRVYAVYQFYCKKTGRPAFSRTVFSRRLRARGYRKERVTQAITGSNLARPYYIHNLALNADGVRWSNEFIGETGATWSSVMLYTPPAGQAV